MIEPPHSIEHGDQPSLGHLGLLIIPAGNQKHAAECPGIDTAIVNDHPQLRLSDNEGGGSPVTLPLLKLAPGEVLLDTALQIGGIRALGAVRSLPYRRPWHLYIMLKPHNDSVGGVLQPESGDTSLDCIAKNFDIRPIEMGVSFMVLNIEMQDSLDPLEVFLGSARVILDGSLSPQLHKASDWSVGDKEPSLPGLSQGQLAPRGRSCSSWSCGTDAKYRVSFAKARSRHSNRERLPLDLFDKAPGMPGANHVELRAVSGSRSIGGLIQLAN